MATYWSIAIGINQYQAFQPLMYAQRDAQLFREFLIKEAGFSPQNCFLLTDAAPKNSRTETLPNRDSILACIARTCQQRLQPDDFLWCFFSGYSLRFQGKDYLMPIEGNPDQVATTGIPIELLFSLFETAPTQNIVLVLDVNRSQAILTEGIGDQTALLAREHGIATLLSCPPDQLSHETLALRQGLFTAALIEGLRQGCVTLSQLVEYLDDRLPQLSDQYWRPRQEPFVIIPLEQRHQLIVPEETAYTLGAFSIPAETVGTPTTSRNGSFSKGMIAPPESSWIFPFREEQAEPDAAEPAPPAFAFLEWQVPPAAAPNPPTPVAPIPAGDTDALFWRRLLTWGSIVVAILMVGVVLRSLPRSTEESPLLPGEPAPTSSVQAPAEATLTNDSSPIQAEPGSALEFAYLEARSRDFVEAKQTLNTIPASEHDANYNQVLEQVNRGLLSDAKIVLTQTRELTTENQASDFVNAIQIARQLQPGEPQYEEAQQYIERWSRTMLDMAQGRADRRNDSSTSIATGNYQTAIKTASLIPPDNAAVYQQAQEAIAHWSQLIFDLAKARAAEAKYDVAVQTAEVIPPEAPVYPEAQAAIDGWRDQPTLYVAPTP